VIAGIAWRTGSTANCSMRRERPSDCHAAEQRDEVAAFQLIEEH
jgi:hypothetical protein